MQILSAPRSDASRRIQAIAFAPSGQDLAVVSDVFVRIFDLRTGQIRLENRFRGVGYPIDCLYLPDSERLIVAAHQLLSQWNIAANTWTELLPPGSRIGARLAMSPASPLIAIADATLSIRWVGSGVQLFDLEKGELQPPLDESLSSTGGIAMDPDGRRLAMGHIVLLRQRGMRSEGRTRPGFPINVYDYVVHICDLPSGNIRQSLPGWKQPVTHLAFSPDGQFLAGIAGQRLRIWDLAHNREVASHRPGTKHFQDLAFTNDGRYLATVSNDKTVCIWETTNWQVHTTYAWGIGRLLNIVFAPDGLRAAAGSDKGQIVIWDVEE